MTFYGLDLVTMDLVPYGGTAQPRVIPHCVLNGRSRTKEGTCTRLPQYTYCTSQPVHNVDLRHYRTGLLPPLCNSTNVVQLLHVYTFTRTASVVEVEASRFVHPPETRWFRSFGIDDSKSVRLTSISGVDMVLRGSRDFRT